MWNGTTPNLKAKPDTTKTKPNTNTWCFTCPLAMTLNTVAKSKEPVAPYNIDMP